MEKFTPTMEIVRFDNEDVIAASGVRLAGFRNGTTGDATLTVGGTPYGKSNWDDGSIIAALLPGVGGASGTLSSDIRFAWSGGGGTLSTIGNHIANDKDESPNAYSSATNGTYTYTRSGQSITGRDFYLFEKQ